MEGPKQTVRRVLRAALPALVWAALALAAAFNHAWADDGGPSVPVLAWHACSDPRQAGFDCATAQVPLDYRRPDGPTVALAVVRHRASQPARRVGALFFNPGGPGLSGVQSLVEWFSRFPPTLVERFDLISWDPRGVGASAAVSCFATDAEANAFFAGTPAGFPVGPSQVRTWTDAYDRFGALCGAKNGDLLAHVSTADTARDLDLLRRAAGEQSVNYYGTGYGSLIGATYANLFPGRVRAMVFDGNVDPVAWIGLGNPSPFLGTSLRLSRDLASNRVLNAFLDRCAAAGPARCPFAGGDAAATRAKFATLLRRIRDKPIPFNSDPVTYAALVNTIANLISVVPAGNGFAGWTAAALYLETLYRGGSGGPLLPKAYDDREQRLAVQCSETDNPRLPGYYRVLATFAFERAADVGPNWAWTDAPCASWPATAAEPYVGPWDRRTADPILVIGITFDPTTAYEGSVAMAEQLARARLLTVNGYGHTALLNPSRCANSYVSRYFESGVLPPPGTVCSQDEAPFSE